jgi:hypothetical protein
VFVNGHEIGRGLNWEESYNFDAAKYLHDGSNSLAIVVENEDGPGGLGDVHLNAADAAAAIQTTPLMLAGQTTGDANGWSHSDLDVTDWKKQMLPENADAGALVSWHRLSFELPEENPHVWLPWLVRAAAHGNGLIFLNGHGIGRYWQQKGSQDFYLPDCWVNHGAGKKNVIAFELRPTADGASIESAEVIPYTAYAEKR